MASEKKELKTLEIFKETTIIGTVTGYDYKTEEEPIKVYMSGCFAEQ